MFVKMHEIGQEVDSNLSVLDHVMTIVESSRRLDRGDVALLLDSVRQTVRSLVDENAALSRQLRDLQRANTGLAWEAVELAQRSSGGREFCGTA